jgi:hypothetical protein
MAHWLSSLVVGFVHSLRSCPCFYHATGGDDSDSDESARSRRLPKALLPPDDDDDDKENASPVLYSNPSAPFAAAMAMMGAVVQETNIDSGKVRQVELLPSVTTFPDCDMINHTQVRIPIQQGMVKDDDLRLVIPKIENEGMQATVLMAHSNAAKNLAEAVDNPIWDEMYGSKSFLAKSAMVAKETEIKNRYEERGVVWVKQVVNLTEKMDRILSFFVEHHGDGTSCIVIVMRGPDSEFLVRKRTELAFAGSASKNYQSSHKH